MIIEKAVQLELQTISIVENPMNTRGKYVAYDFNMKSPSSYYFFKQPKKVGEEDFSIVWGHSPKIQYLSKDYKAFEKLILPIIIADLPPLFKKEHIGNWHLNISDYSKLIDDRSWGIYYCADTYRNKDRVKQYCERNIVVDSNFMAKIISQLPIEISELKVIKR